MYDLEIIKRSHHILCKPNNSHARMMIDRFSTTLIKYSLSMVGGETVRIKDKVYATRNATKQEYRFHYNLLDKFLNHCHNLKINIKEEPPILGLSVDFPIFDKWKLRDDQEDYYNYAIENPKLWEQPNRILTCQPGAGKSFIMMKSISEYGRRTILFMRPGFVKNFVREMIDTFDIDISEIIFVAGIEELNDLISRAINNDIFEKIIIISNKTYYFYISSYLELEPNIFAARYNCHPDNFFKLLEVGYRLIDEVHLDFHFNHRLDLFTNISKSLSSSATLVHGGDEFMKKIQEVTYPDKDRFKQKRFNKYVDVIAQFYNLSHPNSVRTKNHGQGFYSHNVYEKYILKDKKRTDNYMSVIKEAIEISYTKNYKEGKRCLIFCSGADTGTILQEKIAKLYPNLKVGRYIATFKDPESVYQESDIIISTLGSCGTAKTIPNLSTVILTIAVDSESANLQGFGRLRDTKDNTKTTFVYFVCEDITVHRNYHYKKRSYLEGRVVSISENHTRIYV